jgi:hypothetical protein
LEAASEECGEAGFVACWIEEIAENDCEAGVAGFEGAALEGVVERGGAGGCDLGEVTEELKRGAFTADGAEGGAECGFRGVIGERADGDAVEAGEGDVSDGGGDAGGAIELTWLTEGHGFAGIEEDGDREFAFFLVEFEEEPIETAVEVPIEVTKIVAWDVAAVIGELDGIAACAAAAFAFERAFCAAACEQLELLELTEECWGQE